MTHAREHKQSHTPTAGYMIGVQLTQRHRSLFCCPMAVGVHQLSRDLIPQGLHSIHMPVSPPLALTQVPLQVALVGLQLQVELRNTGLSLLQLHGESLGGGSSRCLACLQDKASTSQAASDLHVAVCAKNTCSLSVDATCTACTHSMYRQYN